MSKRKAYGQMERVLILVIDRSLNWNDRLPGMREVLVG